MTEGVAIESVDYSLYLVTGRDLLPKGKVSIPTGIIVSLIRCNYEVQDYLESLEQVILPLFSIPDVFICGTAVTERRSYRRPSPREECRHSGSEADRELIIIRSQSQTLNTVPQDSTGFSSNLQTLQCTNPYQ
jgi:hypothetical protein